MQRRGAIALAACAVAVLIPVSAGGGLADEPFKLGVEQKGYVEPPPQQGYADYPSYPAYTPPRQPLQGRAGAQGGPPLQGAIQQQAPSRPPIQAGIQKQVLPPQFLGVWNVSGQRNKVQAQPEFQAGAERSFAMSTNNIWEIGGDPNSGYTIGSNTGVKTQIVVDKVQGNTAFIRYQHPIGNTMAQEAVVLQLSPDGRQFSGLERISIVKQNQPPRAQITYGLTGIRQR